MSTVNNVDFSNITDVPTLIRFLNPFSQQILTALRNGLSFQDNIRNTTAIIYFPTSGQNVQVAHKLGATPIGYIPIRMSQATTIYDGATLTMGPTFVNLRSSVSGVTVTMMFF